MKRVAAWLLLIATAIMAPSAKSIPTAVAAEAEEGMPSAISGPSDNAVTASTIVCAAMDVDLGGIIVKSDPFGNEKALVQNADAIVYGWFDSADRELPTGQTVGRRELVNFVQTFHVQKRLKGETRQLLRILATGVEPLPDAGDPLNHAYPGPLAEGAYVCFLKRIPGSDTYRLAGGWQGVYPVHDGKTIALRNEGFPQLDGLTVEEFEKRVQRGGS